MPRQELHSDRLSIEQKPVISDDPSQYDGDIVIADKEAMKAMLNKAYDDELSFNEEPVTIRLEPSTEKNAASKHPYWVNGKPAEVWMEGRGWVEMGYLPLGAVLTVKRKVLEVMLREKTDSVHTKVVKNEDGDANNIIQRYTSPVHSFSIIEDKNPRGAAWATELRRRNA